MTDEDRDPETGRYTARFSDEELRRVVAERAPVGTAEIADVFECSQPGAYKRLQALEEADEISSQLIGGNRVWVVLE